RYQLQPPDGNNRYWIDEISLFLGIWQGTKENGTGYWLRWWDQPGELLLWGSELVIEEQQRAQQERQRAEQERQRAEQERQRAEKLAAQLRAAGIEPQG
ncbi:MAG: Uma2 family endonuclease, partial [Moorea sp. SIO3I6]|nr:Uma2 family endonuclease [Moorena sp. SIO3I6]